MVEGIKVLIVDDKPRTRAGLKALLQTWEPVGEIAEAANGEEAVRMVQEMEPDLVLMDVLMPGMDGLQATRLITGIHPHVKVIAWSMHSYYQADALFAGSAAFVQKGASVEKLLGLIETVLTDP